MEALSAISPSVDALDDVDAYLQQWTSGIAGQTFRWRGEIHPDERAAFADRLRSFWPTAVEAN